MNFFNDDGDDRYDFSGGKGGLFKQQQNKSKKARRDEQTYGIFGEGEGSSEEDSRKKDKPSFLQAKLPVASMSFIKSDKILYNPEAGKVKVNYGKKKKEAQEESTEKGKEDNKKAKKSVKISEERNEEIVFNKDKRIVDDFVLSDDEIQEEEDMIQARLNKEVMKRKNKFNLKNTNQKQEMGDFGLPSILGKRRNPIFETSKQEKAEQRAEEEMIEKMGDSEAKALRIMQSFGYKVGKGLGSKEQGRVEPVKAVKKTILDGTKPPNARFDVDRSSMGTDLMKDLMEEEEGDENVEVQERPKLWQKGKRRTGINKRGNLLRAESTKLGSLKESEIVQPIQQQQKIIDMRGPQTMYFEDYSAIKNLEQQPRQKITAIPSSQSGVLGEMLFTLRGHVDKSKHNILSNERKIKIEKDKIVNFNYEKSQLESDQLKYQTDIENLKVLKAKLTLFKASSANLNSQDVLDLFNDCFNATSEQFAYLNLEHLFIETINKKLQTELQNWKISEDTIDDNFSLFGDIKEFLKKILRFKEYLKFKSYTDKSSFDFSTNQSYDETKLQNYMSNLFSQAWTTPIRNHILNEWNPNDPDILIAVFDKWKSVVPASQLTQIFDSVLMPKLQQYVDTWSPTTEKIPIHISLHPWFPLLGEKRLEQLWKSIQLKISQLLQKWEPQDKSALVLLKPWLRVFDRSSWENLIIRLILPKLMYGLRDFEVNPKKQRIEPIKWLLDWADYIPQDNLIVILETYVIKKIADVLKEWTSSPGCKLEEVRGWLTGWKELIGEKIMSIPAVRHEFNNIEKMIK